MSAGEPSGRLYAALVETAVARAAPAAVIHRFDAGRACGAVFGFVEGLRAAPALRRSLAETARAVAELRPDLVLLVGFSGYHLALGRRCRRLGLPVAFFAPPQLWAWGGWRAGALRRAADLVICLFGFEAKWLRARGIPAEFAGNPLADLARPAAGRAETLSRLGLAPADRYLAFLPGSRPAERDWHRPVFDRVETPGRHRVWLLPDEPGDPAALLAAAAGRYDALAHADAAVVVSGTATLETALLGTPQVACYHLSPATRLLARLLVRSRRFALPNILLGRPSVPELLEPTPAAIGRELAALLADPARQARARQDARELRALLGPPGAAEHIARLLLDRAGL